MSSKKRSKRTDSCEMFGHVIGKIKNLHNIDHLQTVICKSIMNRFKFSVETHERLPWPRYTCMMGNPQNVAVEISGNKIHMLETMGLFLTKNSS